MAHERRRFGYRRLHVLKDIMAGKTRVSVETKKLRSNAIVRSGAVTATQTVGLLGGIITYAVEAGIMSPISLSFRSRVAS